MGKDMDTVAVERSSILLIYTGGTIGMVETGQGPGWKLEDGSTYYWPLNEHCMVLIGYDDSRYYFADPYRGMVKSYSHWLCESRYKDIGMSNNEIPVAYIQETYSLSSGYLCGKIGLREARSL